MRDWGVNEKDVMIFAVVMLSPLFLSLFIPPFYFWNGYLCRIEEHWLGTQDLLEFCWCMKVLTSIFPCRCSPEDWFYRFLCMEFVTFYFFYFTIIRIFRCMSRKDQGPLPPLVSNSFKPFLVFPQFSLSSLHSFSSLPAIFSSALLNCFQCVEEFRLFRESISSLSWQDFHL